MLEVRKEEWNGTQYSKYKMSYYLPISGAFAVPLTPHYTRVEKHSHSERFAAENALLFCSCFFPKGHEFEAKTGKMSF